MDGFLSDDGVAVKPETEYFLRGGDIATTIAAEVKNDFIRAFILDFFG